MPAPLRGSPKRATLVGARVIGGAALPSLLPLIATIAAAAAAPQGRDARALDLRGLFSADDYPLESLRNNEQGRVKVKLGVDASGAVSSCTIVESSGHSALDERTCAVLQERAKFEPATDSRGNPIASDFTQEISWKLGMSGPTPMPRGEWMLRMTVGLTGDGAMVSCRTEAAGVRAPSGSCDTNGQRLGGGQAKPFGYAINETYFYPVAPESAPTAAELGGAVLASRQVSRVTISPDGQIIACKAVVSRGAATSHRDKCQMLANFRFTSAPEGSGPTVGTLVHSDYFMTAD